MNGNYDNWKTTDTNDVGSVEDDCTRDCEGCPTCKPEESCPDTLPDPSSGMWKDECLPTDLPGNPWPSLFDE
jgi:hypothetical protein